MGDGGGRGQKFQKMGGVIYGRPHITYFSNFINYIPVFLEKIGIEISFVPHAKFVILKC